MQAPGATSSVTEASASERTRGRGLVDRQLHAHALQYGVHLRRVAVLAHVLLRCVGGRWVGEVGGAWVVRGWRVRLVGARLGEDACFLGGVLSRGCQG